jgi:spore coat polysaccharide biosynthesis protein SpsF
MPELIDQMVDVFYEQNVEYLSNTLEPTFPDGLDVEIMQCGVLEKLATFKLGSKELEHVTYGVCARPEIFKLSNFRNESDFSRKRWTVDYQEDFEFVSRIYRQFAGRESEFTFTELCDFLQENPTIETLNHTYRRNLEINSKKSQGQ